MTMIVTTLMLLANSMIALKGEAEVSGNYIPLLQVIETDRLSAEQKDALKNIYLGKSPVEGETRTIALDDVRRELSLRGYGENDFALSGTAVTVKRTSATSDASAAFWKESLRRAIRALNANRRVIGVERIHVVILGVIPDIHKEMAFTGDIRETAAGEYVAMLRDPATGDETEVRCVAEIKIRQAVCEAARDIRSGETIKPEDIRSAWLLPEETKGAMTDANLVKGSRAAKKICAGEQITRDHLRLTPVVKRLALVRARGTYLETTARALAAGAVGDVITLEYERTKNQFKGRVVSDSLVEIVED